MKEYNFEVFDSRNTCVREKESFLKELSASYKAKVKSRSGYGKVIVSSDLGFEEYEKGQLVSWSYPNGLGQIKANS